MAKATFTEKAKADFNNGLPILIKTQHGKTVIVKKADLIACFGKGVTFNSIITFGYKNANITSLTENLL